MEAVVLIHGTGGIKAASQLTLQEQQYCCRLFFKLDILSGLSGPPRLSYLKIPVETFAAPYSIYIISRFCKNVNNGYG